MKILVDMNLSPALCAFLVDEGFVAVHWSAVGDPRASDQIVAQWAADNGHVLLTHDLDFSAILAATKATGPSVLQVRTQDLSPPSLALLLAHVLREHEAALRLGAIVTIDASLSRVRVLPLANREP